MKEFFKNDVKILIEDEYSLNWFSNFFNKWEKETFFILDHYKNKEGIYIDIGSWLGPTVLYSSKKYKKIISIEADPVALNMLKKNIVSNKLKNIEIVEKCLSNNSGKKIKFGSNGKLGNSMSTMLTSYQNIDSKRSKWINEKDEFVEVETITLEKILSDLKWKEKISLIKIDIEGGEAIVIPALKNFLSIYRPPLYISLHHMFLPKHEILKIINILSKIYENIYIIQDNIKIKKTKEEIINNYFEILFD